MSATKTLIHYPMRVRLQLAYAGNIAVVLRGLSITERLCREILGLPMHPGLSNVDVEAGV